MAEKQSLLSIGVWNRKKKEEKMKYKLTAFFKVPTILFEIVWKQKHMKHMKTEFSF